MLYLQSAFEEEPAHSSSAWDAVLAKASAAGVTNSTTNATLQMANQGVAKALVAEAA